MAFLIWEKTGREGWYEAEKIIKGQEEFDKWLVSQGIQKLRDDWA